jgi:murein DD-endopeptidase MepM/ murein hydrolase activator NlpD
VTETGIAEITGKNLSAVNAVKLRSADGKVKVDPIAAKETSVKFKVPRGAISGKPVLLDEYGAAVASPVKLKVKPEAELTEVEGFELRKAAAAPKKTFFNGKRRSQVDYLFEAEGPTDIRIDVLKGKKRKLVDSIVKRDQQPFANNSARWDGLADSGKVAPNGKYKFEVTQLSGGSGERAKFRYYDHKFPLAGRHDYGDGLGAGRGHQGQDVFAKCGNPIYAARGGRVQVKASHSAAGNYIVIDGRKTGRDYVYMHMEKKGRPKEGSRVRTGEMIGRESDTGDAQGCHLHFELWSAPGWYEGGHVLNPTRPLKKWDKWS